MSAQLADQPVQGQQELEVRTYEPSLRQDVMAAANACL